MKKGSSALIRLYYVGKVIGLCPYDLDEANMPRSSSFGLMYGVILSVAYTIVSHGIISERFKLAYPHQTILSIIASSILLSVIFLCVVVSWMVFACGQTRFRSLIENFNDTKDLMGELGILEDENNLIRRFIRYIVVVNSLFYVMLTGEQMALYFNPTYDATLWITFGVVRPTAFVTIVIFTNLLLVLRERFLALNKRILVLERVTAVGARSWIHSYRVRSGKGVERIRTSQMGTKLKMVVRLHGELCDLTERVCEFFSPVLFFVAIERFINILVSCHATCLFLRHTDDRRRENYVVSIVVSLFTMVDVIIFGYFATVCEMTSNEAKETANVLHKTWMLPQSDQSVKMLLQRRLRITIFGFLDMGFSLFCKMTTTITTYMVIMLQLEDY
ncbi:uncharacterized protein LOC111673882 [Orussus abietinus]|uniref:uncharacterized protein LOC111673882 n=1 Tax=Orussus abietinus TaxID=222816 RepID=UPI000C715F99|nr:uncharacterized protein LOC111673882 [Orussus abietinus]